MEKKSQKSVYFFHTLILLAIILGVLLIIGTIYGVARPADAKPLFRLGNTRARTDGSSSDITTLDGFNVFSGIGRLRIPLSNSSTLILSIAFPYPAEDRAFSEELAVKIGDFRSIATEYFSSLPAERLLIIDEEAAKSEILRRYNSGLRLGSINALYFSDMIIIDSYE